MSQKRDNRQDTNSSITTTTTTDTHTHKKRDNV